MTLQPWWEKWDGLLEDELRELEEAGIRYDLDEDTKSKHGVIQVRVYPEVDGRQLELTATYSDLFPYFRFEVQGPDLPLPHHHHPFGGNLCLIGRGTENWSVDDSLADFLTKRLPITLRAGASENRDEVADLEEPQAEPFSDYYPYPAGPLLVVDSAWDVRGPRGRLLLGLEDVAVPGMVRGVVLEVQDDAGRKLVSSDDVLRDLYPTKAMARWIRTPAPVRQGDPSSFVSELVDLDGDLATPLWQQVGRTRVDILGVIFPEETAWREEGDGWVFIVRHEVK